jgi:hypothetical protein
MLIRAKPLISFSITETIWGSKGLPARPARESEPGKRLRAAGAAGRGPRRRQTRFGRRMVGHWWRRAGA